MVNEEQMSVLQSMVVVDSESARLNVSQMVAGAAAWCRSPPGQFESPENTTSVLDLACWT